MKGFQMGRRGERAIKARRQLFLSSTIIGSETWEPNAPARK